MNDLNKKLKTRARLYICFYVVYCLIIAAQLALVIDASSSDDSRRLTSGILLLNACGLLMTNLLLRLPLKRSKVIASLWFFMQNLKGEFKMEMKFLDGLVGKNVVINTVEGIETGVIESVDGETVVLAKYKKKTGALIKTCYITKSMISRVEVTAAQ